MNTPRLYDIEESKLLRTQLYGLSKTREERREATLKKYLKQKAVKESLSKGLKTCTKCGEDKPLTDFYVDKTNFSGYSSYCKDCKKGSNGNSNSTASNVSA